MQNMVIEIVAMLVATIITGVITALAAFLQGKIKSEKINLSLTRLEMATNATVASLQQEIVNEWREKGGGKLPPEIVHDLKICAKSRVRALLDDPAAKLLESAGVELDKLIQALVEKAVLEFKRVN